MEEVAPLRMLGRVKLGLQSVWQDAVSRRAKRRRSFKMVCSMYFGKEIL